ncbi:hypothetical protein ACFWP3_30050 [Streptomyces sp. NPDC058525]|uniref:hypothetical protein n=1 Tax=Streptomyces sp. NPDC058525 TaxID=3346538 RepID=UPI00365F0D68
MTANRHQPGAPPYRSFPRNMRKRRHQLIAPVGVHNPRHEKSETTMTESTTTVKYDVTVDFGCIELTGALVHDNETRVLELKNAEGPAEPISISLQGYGLMPEPGNVFIKDWSEHSGLTARLARVGLVTPLHALTVGPYRSTAYEVQVTL